MGDVVAQLFRPGQRVFGRVGEPAERGLWHAIPQPEVLSSLTIPRCYQRRGRISSKSFMSYSRSPDPQPSYEGASMRRRVLAIACVVVAMVAGCIGRPSGQSVEATASAIISPSCDRAPFDLSQDRTAIARIRSKYPNLSDDLVAFTVGLLPVPCQNSMRARELAISRPSHAQAARWYSLITPSRIRLRRMVALRSITTVGSCSGGRWDRL